MARLQSPYRILTVQTSLEETMRLGDDYRVSEAWEEWRAGDLLAWLEEHHPDLLSLPVALLPPDATGEGTVFEVDGEGEPVTHRPLYRTRRVHRSLAPH